MVTFKNSGRAAEVVLLTWDEVKSLPDPTFLVEGILPRNALAQIFGAKGAGKTFVALDIALSVATGTPWQDNWDVYGGDVVYVAGEGHSGLKKRIRAWLEWQQRGNDALSRFRLKPSALPLGDPTEVEAFVRAVCDCFPSGKAALVVLDTQARCTSGLEENSATDMGVAVEAAERIKRETGATVLLVHHPGRQGHDRGSTAIPGALDTQVKLVGSLAALRLECVKQKDWEEFKPIGLKLSPMGDSLVPVLRGSSVVPAGPAGLTLKQRTTLNALGDHFANGAHYGEWKATAREAGVGSGTFAKALKVLLDAGLVLKDGSIYRVVLSDESGEARREVVQLSTTPLGGGLVDSDASEDASDTCADVQEAWEESRDASR